MKNNVNKKSSVFKAGPAAALAGLICVTSVFFAGCGSVKDGSASGEINRASAETVSQTTLRASDSSITIDAGEITATVTGVDGNVVSLRIGGGRGSRETGSGQAPDGMTPPDMGNGGGQRPGGFGGSNGFSDLTGGKSGSDQSDGSADEGGSSDMQSGETPQLPDGMTPPDMQSGETPQLPDGMTPPDMQSGEMPELPDGMTPPDMGNGGGRENGRGGISATLTLADDAVILDADGNEVSASDIAAGGTLTITVGENGSVEKIVISAASDETTVPDAGYQIDDISSI